MPGAAHDVERVSEAMSIKWNNRVCEKRRLGHDVIALSYGEAYFEVSTFFETIVWETYRAMLIIRLAERRAKSMGELPVATSTSPSPQRSAAAVKDAMVQHVKGEMSIWEELARKSVRDGYGGTSSAFLKHVAATFGGRATEADDRRFEAIVRDLKGQAAKLVANMSRRERCCSPHRPDRWWLVTACRG